MAYQNINQYVYKKFYLRPIYTGQDMSLASDERDYNQEVVFSPFVIGVDDGQVLPINIDFGSTANTETFNLSYNDYDFDNIVISSNYWLPSDYNPYCLTSQTICDIGLTGTDNGLVTGMTGQTIEIFNYPLTGANKFDRYTFGQQMKFHQITGFTDSPNHRFSGVSDGTIYSIVSKSASTVGYYQQLYGGFYQGFYKLFGFEHQVLPTRMPKGWTAEFLIKPRLVDEFIPPSGYTTANDFRPNNENFFFYLGTRAENKYWHHASGETSDSGYTRVTSGLTTLQTCACADTAVTNSDCAYVYPPTGSSVIHSACTCSCGCYYCSVNVDEPEHDPLYDSMSNALGIKFSGDPGNPNVCIRVLRMTGDCITTGTCVTGQTSVTGYTIDEYCSSRGIYYNCSGTSFVEQEHWVQIDAVWERYTWFDECDLIYKGGLGTITSFPYSATVVGDTISLIEPPTTHSGSPAPRKVEIVELNNQWLLEKEFRLGDLKIFVNGMLFFVVPDFEEIIPRGLDTIKERQIGVPFNMSIGGGTQGLHENLVFSGLPTSLTNDYIQDPELFPDDILSATTLSGLTTNILLERYFAGSFDGGLSQFRFYTKPLSVPEVQHNFRILKDEYVLYDPFCPSCLPTPEDLEITINECDCPPEYEQLENGNCAPITEVSPTGLTCPDGCEYLVRDGVPYCKCLGAEIGCEDVPERPINFCMDYMVVTYEFDDGRDLDIKVALFDTTQTSYLGWCAAVNYPTTVSGWPNNFDDVILTWGGDNTGVGYESVLVNIPKYVSLFPSNTEIKLDLRCWWYNQVGIQPVRIRVEAYQGGTMEIYSISSGRYNWRNPTATATRTFISPGSIINGPAISDCIPLGQRLTTFTYNIETCEGQFDNNDPAPPPIGNLTPTPTPTPTLTPNLQVYTVFVHVPCEDNLPTPTPTPTQTNTSTQTPTPTPTNTEGLTQTPTPTNTLTPTPTRPLEADFQYSYRIGSGGSFVNWNTVSNSTDAGVELCDYWATVGSTSLGFIVKYYGVLQVGTYLGTYSNYSIPISTGNYIYGDYPSVVGGTNYWVKVNSSGYITEFTLISPVCPTPTNTPTTTPTPTPTDPYTGITSTPTNTPTNTPSSVTPTPTPTNTQTPTPTPTNTQTPTNTPTQTNTSTQTPTPTNTPTTTNTVTPTNTQTPTNTPTQTQTPTNTPTNTKTPTPTQTPPNGLLCRDCSDPLIFRVISISSGASIGDFVDLAASFGGSSIGCFEVVQTYSGTLSASLRGIYTDCTCT